MGARVTVPALYVTGDRDLVRGFRGMDRLLPRSSTSFRIYEARSFSRAVATGRSRSGRPRSNAAMLRFLAEVK